mmetsp:Transcript_1043/g.2987  ORF Transcript_1043/g.2987 Transcript_1043/m.2987 type:complete len:359 (+) Transcript_1043:65-1141(+)
MGAAEFILSLIAGLSTIFACVCSFHLIYMHLLNYNFPEYQVYIVRILGMVPIYSVTSFLSLVDRDTNRSLISDLFRDCYESFVIYNFLVLLIHFGGGERSLVYYLETKPRMRHPWPLSEVLPPIRLGASFMHAVRASCLQFVFVKPACVILLLYSENDQFPILTYPRMAALTDLIINVSVSVALYGLMLLYLATKEPIQPFRPLPKFLAVKAVIFFSFWQGFGLTLAVQLGIISDIEGNYTAREQVAAIQNFLVCLEMSIAAICHHFVFSYKDYMSPVLGTSQAVMITEERGSLFKHFGEVVNFKDILRDAHNLYGATNSRNPFETELVDGTPVVTPVDAIIEGKNSSNFDAREAENF